MGLPAWPTKKRGVLPRAREHYPQHAHTLPPPPPAVASPAPVCAAGVPCPPRLGPRRRRCPRPSRPGGRRHRPPPCPGIDAAGLPGPTPPAASPAPVGVAAGCLPGRAALSDSPAPVSAALSLPCPPPPSPTPVGATPRRLPPPWPRPASPCLLPGRARGANPVPCAPTRHPDLCSLGHVAHTANDEVNSYSSVFLWRT